VYGRIPPETKTPPCTGGDGPRKLEEGPRDISPLGIRGLFGSVSEWVLDDAAPYDSPTWANVALIDPHAELASARRVFRGGAWMTDATRPIFRYTPNGTEGYVPIGIRCAYPAKKP
jgi:formylglycine-generating enzyme required for sulfatase activity